MLPRHQPDRIRIAFDDHRLVANAGLILPSTLALRLGLPQLVDRRLDLGHATGRANTGDKMMTLVASTPPLSRGQGLAGGDCINDADALRADGTARVLGFTAKAPSTPVFARAGSGRLPAQLQVGPCPPTGPGEGHATPRLHRCAGLSPAAGRRRRNRRRADVPAARGPGQHRPRRRPLPA